MHSLGYLGGTRIDYFFVGKPYGTGSYNAKVGYYPAKFFIPPENPNSQPWSYSYLTYKPGDAYEPNDSLSTAYYINKGTYYPTIHNSTDQDWFLVYHSGGLLNVTMTGLPTGYDYDLYLLNSSGSVIASSLNGGNANENISINLSSGYYYVRVIPYIGYSPGVVYTLQVL